MIIDVPNPSVALAVEDSPPRNKTTHHLRLGNRALTGKACR